MQNSTKTLISVMFYIFFGRIRAVVLNLSSAGFGRADSAGFGRNSSSRTTSHTEHWNIFYKGGEVPLNSPIHHREISTGELNKTQLNFHDREILVARRVVLN